MRLGCILLIVLSLFLVACNSPETSQEPVPVSKCDSYTSEYNVIRCKAVEAEDISMCDPITKDATRETCIMMIAEIVQDESQLADCKLSRNKNYEITCQALIKKDVTHCYTMAESISSRSDLAMRDCIDLVARKMKDKTVCNAFKTGTEYLLDVCEDSTSGCEGMWVDGADQHVADCRSNIE